jgi:glyceraldehyde 3-phosphate dehydrogenase
MEPCTDREEDLTVAIRIGINGLGRIGRNTFRAIEKHPDVELVAVNDITDSSTMAHLLQYDSILGTYAHQVLADGDSISVNGKRLRTFSEAQPEKLPWRELGVDIVLECTGKFTDARARKHIDSGGARKVVLSAPGKNEDVTIVLGVNESQYDPEHHSVISNASCTTNCLAPVVKVLHDSFGLESAIMTTVHAYTGGQQLVDAPHRDLRRARAATLSMIPTTTGAVRAMTKVIPELEGRLTGIAVRVPTPTVSLVDLSAVFVRPVSVDAINEAFREAAEKTLRGIIAVCDRPLVSVDFAGDPHSAVVDSLSTLVVGERHGKVLAWYDSEWGYACRLADLAAFVGSRLR